MRARLLVAPALLAVAAVVLAAAAPAFVDGDGRDNGAVAPLRAIQRDADVGPPPTGESRTSDSSATTPPIRDQRPSRTRRVAKPPTRWTFVWPARASADYYNVRFFRGRSLIFEAWPRRARVVIPAAGVSRGHPFRFSPGTYRWVVRPGFGRRAVRRYGRPIVVSEWTLRLPAAR